MDSYISFPFTDHMQDGLSVGLDEHLQLEYASRDRTADPATWTPYGPHLNVPTGIHTVTPADDLIARLKCQDGSLYL
jgi:hypothetical protein